MSYIGNTQQNQSYVPAVDFFNGDGSTVAFTLSRPVASVAAVQVIVSNVSQKPGDAYTVSGSTITFTSAPPSGSNNVYVYYTSPNTQVVQPGQGTVYPSSLSTGGPTWNTAGNLGLGVTPSAFTAGKAFEVAYSGNALWGTGVGDLSLLANVKYNGALQYANSGVGANRFVATGGTYQWYTAPSGTAGNAISFTQAMTLDASGNLGVGAITPAYKLDVVTNSGIRVLATSDLSTGGASFLRFGGSNNAAAGYVGFGGTANTLDISNALSGNLTFGTASTERMRLDSTGAVFINRTSIVSGYSSTLNLSYDGGNTRYGIMLQAAANNTTPISFINASGIVAGYISMATSTVAYNTASDYRLKENIKPMQNALGVVAQLNPVTYNWKADGSDGQGFIAHELQAVVPDCVTGEKDAVRTVDVLDEDGKKIGTKEEPVYQGIDTSFLVATLTKAIQEQQAQIETLTTRLTAAEEQILALGVK